jgi:hypothetical protein
MCGFPLSIMAREVGRPAFPLPEFLLASMLGRFGLPKLARGALEHVKHPIIVDGTAFVRSQRRRAASCASTASTSASIATTRLLCASVTRPPACCSFCSSATSSVGVWLCMPDQLNLSWDANFQIVVRTVSSQGWSTANPTRGPPRTRNSAAHVTVP